MIHDTTSCPCFSGKPYDYCCKPYHDGIQPENALLLMRARFAAFHLNLSEFIIKTTHPAHPEYLENNSKWATEITNFCEQTSFNGLDILEFSENKDIASVTFKALLSVDNEESSFIEKSFFEKRQGRWLYKNAQIIEAAEPSLLTRKPLKILPLAYYGEAVLRKKACPIHVITDQVKELVEAMIETMDLTDGIGLAAPQVHHSIQLFIMRKPYMEGKKLVFKEVKVFINPLLLESSEELFRDQEGCLSIPHIRHAVSRPKTITIEYTDLQGNRLTGTFTGWEAKIIQHEYDHLQGLFFIDRLDTKEQAKLSHALAKLEKRLHDHKSL